MAKTTKKTPVPTKAFQFKITLKQAPLPIWRRMIVTNNINFDDFHQNIQFFMGWDNCHLYHFCKGRNLFIVESIDTDGWGAGDEILASETYLSELFVKEKDKLLYEYDFGDGWLHEIVLEKILDLDTTKKYPIYVTGKGMCPPEDCGGVYGYAEILEALKDPKHEQYEEYCEWLGIESGDEWNPEEFDINDYQ